MHEAWRTTCRVIMGRTVSLRVCDRVGEGTCPREDAVVWATHEIAVAVHAAVVLPHCKHVSKHCMASRVYNKPTIGHGRVWTCAPELNANPEPVSKVCLAYKADNPCLLLLKYDLVSRLELKRTREEQRSREKQTEVLHPER